MRFGYLSWRGGDFHRGVRALREFREAAIEVLRPSSRQTIEEHCTQAVLVCLQSDKHQGDNAFYPLV